MRKVFIPQSWIVKDKVERLAEVQIEKKMSYEMSETKPEKMEENTRCFEEAPEDFDETVSEYAMAFLSDF